MQQISGICILFNVNLFVFFDIVYNYKEGFFKMAFLQTYLFPLN